MEDFERIYGGILENIQRSFAAELKEKLLKEPMEKLLKQYICYTNPWRNFQWIYEIISGTFFENIKSLESLEEFQNESIKKVPKKTVKSFPIEFRF